MKINFQEATLIVENSKKEGAYARYLKLIATLAQSISKQWHVIISGMVFIFTSFFQEVRDYSR